MGTLIGQQKGKGIQVTTDGQRLIYSGSRQYLVFDESGTEGEGIILSTSGLPRVNVFYNFDGVPVPLTCKGKKAQQWENNNKYWTVSADFDNEPQNTDSDTGGNETDSGDPTTWYAIIKFDFETYEDVLGWKVNFAKRPYLPPITKTSLMPVIKFTQYMPPNLTIYELVHEYHEVLNDSDFLNAKPRYWKLSISDAEFGVVNGYKCWKVDFELRYKKARMLYNVYDSDGNRVTADVDVDSISMLPGWSVYVPQIDTLDINKTPFADIKENNGDFGKLETDGTFKADQSEDVILKEETMYPVKDFSFLRIRQNNT